METSIPRPGSAFLVLVAVTFLASCDRDSVGPQIGQPEMPRSTFGAMDAPAHDDFDDAIIVESIPFTHVVDTSEATTAADDPECFGQGPTVWYSFTPSEAGFYEANTFGSEYDTTLGAYLGERGNLIEIACNDDWESLQSRIVVELAPEVTVHFMVGAWASGPGGHLVFNLDVTGPPPPPPPPPPPFIVSLSLDRSGGFDGKSGVAFVRGTATCSLWSSANIFGVLRQRIGRIVAEAPFWHFFECDGTTSWEVEARSQTALFVGGPAEVWVDASFFDPVHGQFGFAQDRGTVRLQGGRRRSSASAFDLSGFDGRTYNSLHEVMRGDPRLKTGKRSP